eukprot:CAMPEP_0170074234 /NCGR_PEP_ID=MMETSP0019_2-20121128/11559_1 /TAXON_ID=98059 /ORGANISM="Dinobryon sp., Strain UTEXLB2267" /LENGTH=77 /DNA_ID=CAMNT_0010284375 /DNA_START=1 /DNA_END=234 /DNA_ORIENTATION=-
MMPFSNAFHLNRPHYRLPPSSLSKEDLDAIQQIVAHSEDRIGKKLERLEDRLGKKYETLSKKLSGISEENVRDKSKH